MHYFQYRDGELYCEDVPLREIAKTFGTPTYVYSGSTLLRHFRVFEEAFGDIDHLTCYSVKANSNIAILNLLVREGSGLDIVSGGELYRALVAGCPGNKIVYSGVGKTAKEMRYAMESDILMFNVESSQEMDTLNEVAQRTNRRARISLRVNPDVDPRTHPYISTGLKKNKFGVAMDEARSLFGVAQKKEALEVVGISCHIGSQITEVSPFVDALSRVLDFVHILRRDGIWVKYV
ncbi:MAG: diaminopimelate decarboxylase family protein, partial [Desulfatiglandales bacterium]